MAAKKEPTKKAAAKKATAKKATKVTRLDNKTATKQERAIAKKSDAASRKKATAERVSRVKGVGNRRATAGEAAQGSAVESEIARLNEARKAEIKAADAKLSGGAIPTSRFRRTGLDDDTAVNAVSESTKSHIRKSAKRQKKDGPPTASIETLKEREHMAEYRDHVKRGRADKASAAKTAYFTHVTTHGASIDDADAMQPCATQGCGGEAHKELDDDICPSCAAAGKV